MRIDRSQGYMVFLLVLFVILTMGCNKKQVDNCDLQTPLYAISSFPIGAAVDDLLLYNDSLYQQICVTQFNRVTPENLLKPAYIHPEENLFNWIESDRFVEFLKSKKISIHGHTLVWHQQNPSWMEQFQGDRSAWETLLRNHIYEIVGRYRLSIHSWDVVNEAFMEDGSFRQNIWLQHIGPTYIEKAFRWAHEANPEAKLFYNDYGMETNPTKRKAVLQFFRNLRLNGVPVDGIGLQMHVDIHFTDISMIEKAIQEIASNHFLLHLSEVDISLNPLGKSYVLNNKDLQDQAAMMYRICKSYKSIQPNLQFGITFWGISDQHSWIRSYFNRLDYPLLFDENYLPKPIYCQLKKI